MATAAPGRGCRASALALALLLAIGRAGTAGAVATVEAIRFGADADRTRLVLEIDRRVAFSVRTLSAPPRLVVELPDVAWRPRPDAFEGPRGLVAARRFGPAEGGRSRLVVDASGPFRVLDAFLIPPRDGHRSFRLIVDLAPAAIVAPSPRADAAAMAPVAVLRARPPARPPRDASPAMPPDIRPLVVVDPGHGGVDVGAVAPDGTQEKDVALAAALELRDLLRRSARYRVALTRERDVFVPLRERLRTARALGADLFLSLHADSLPGHPEIRGASVYTLSAEASDAEAARLAATENQADLLAGEDLSAADPATAGILLDMSQGQARNGSVRLADRLVAELGAVAPLVRNTRRFAGFAVLKSPDTPSALLELGYLSHPDDARALTDPRYRARLAAAILRAVDRHFAPAR